MFYTVYQITNTMSGKIYVGMHQTEDLEDGYLGSGQIIRRAISKHGRGNFKKDILFVFDNPEAMRAKELEIVTEEFVARDDTYNLNVGGHGGWYWANKVYTVEQREQSLQRAHSERKRLALTDPHFLDKTRESSRRTFILLNSTGRAKHDTFKDRKHSEESKAKTRETMKGRGLGSDNSQYGTLWVCKPGETAKKIPTHDLDLAMADGWVRGRKPH